MKGHNDWVKALIVSPDDKFLYSMSDDMTIRTWKLPNFDNYRILDAEIPFNNPSFMMVGRIYPQYIYFITRNCYGKIDQSNLNRYSFVKVTEENISIFAINPVNDRLCVFLPLEKVDSEEDLYKYSIVIYHPIDLTPQKTYTIELKDSYSVTYSLDGQLLIVGYRTGFTIFNENSMERLQFIRTSSANVSLLLCAPNRRDLYTGDSQKFIKKYDLQGLGSSKKITISAPGEITQLLMSADSEYLIALDLTETVSIYATSRMIVLSSLNLKDIKQIEFPGDSSMLYCMFDQSIKAISFPSLSTCYILQFHLRIHTFAFNYDKEIIIFSNEKILIYTHPSACNSVCAYGDTDSLNKYFQFISN